MNDGRVNAKRIPDTAIVGTGPIVIYDDDPDLFLYDLSKIVVKKRNATSNQNYIAQPPGNGGTPPPGGTFPPGVIPPPGGTPPPVEPLPPLDIVDLTDIENISYDQYYDPTSKLVKYKAVIKIRNSSSKKNNVSGVDARVANTNA
jgi:hypothetical protein